MNDQPVPVSGEDQPDPRVMLAAEAIASRYQDSPRQYLGDAQRVVDALDAADRAAGIRRTKPDPQLTEDSHRVSAELYELVARMEAGEELSNAHIAATLALAAKRLGRHRA